MMNKKINIEFTTWVNKNFYVIAFTSFKKYKRITDDSSVWPIDFEETTISEMYDYFIINKHG